MKAIHHLNIGTVAAVIASAASRRSASHLLESIDRHTRLAREKNHVCW